MPKIKRIRDGAGITCALIAVCHFKLLLVDILFRIQKFVNNLKMFTSNADLQLTTLLLLRVGLLGLNHDILQYFRLGKVQTCLSESL